MLRQLEGIEVQAIPKPADNLVTDAETWSYDGRRDPVEVEQPLCPHESATQTQGVGVVQDHPGRRQQDEEQGPRDPEATMPAR